MRNVNGKHVLQKITYVHPQKLLRKVDMAVDMA